MKLKRVLGPLAYLRIDFTFSTRNVYHAIAALMQSRAFSGTSPTRAFFDGCILLLVSVLFILLPLIAVVTAPFSLLRAVLTKQGREDLKMTAALAEAGRIDWKLGTVKEQPSSPEEGTDAST